MYCSIFSGYEPPAKSVPKLITSLSRSKGLWADEWHINLGSFITVAIQWCIQAQNLQPLSVLVVQRLALDCLQGTCMFL